MRVIKLKYTDRETAIVDLKSKGVYNEDLSFGENVHAIVEVGKLIDVEATYDQDGDEVTPNTFLEGYHYDIMYDGEIYFENEIQVNNHKHTFFGH